MNIRSNLYNFIRGALVVAALLAGGFVTDDAHSQVGGPYSKFGPVNGILKGSVSTYNTSAATSSDVSALFCAPSTSLFLRADGTCVTPSGIVAGSNTQVQYNNSGAFGASSLFTFTPGSVVLNLGASTTPGTFSVGTLDTMVVNGVTVPIPSFAANSNIQGVFENHSYVNGTAAGGARYYGVRSEGTISSPLIVANGDHLSTFYAAGYNGSSYSLGGSMTWLVDGTPGASAMPTDVDIALSPAGSQTPASVFKLYGTGSYGVNGSQGTAGNVLTSGGTGAAAWGTVNLASANAVTNILGAANGGTGNGFTAFSGPATTMKTFTLPNASASILTTNAAVTVPQGGTGGATLTNHGVLLGQGAGNISSVAAMAADTLLQGQGTGADPAAVSINNCGSSTAALSYSTSTHTFGCQTISVGGTGTVTSLTSGTGITLSPSTITTTGSIALDQAVSPNMSGTWTFTRNTTTTPSVSVGTTGSQGILCVGNSTCNQLATSGDPAHTIELVDNGGSLQGIRFMTFASGAAAISPLHWARANGTPASPTAILSGDNIMSLGARGYDGTGMSGSELAIEGIASENWGTNNHGSYIDFQVTPTADASGARKSVLQIRATTSATTPTMVTNGVGSTSVGYMPVTDTAGTRFGYWGKASGANSTVTYESDAGLGLVGNNGTDQLTINTSHTLGYSGSGGMTVGSPTGGDQGAGTINVASQLYVNGVSAGPVTGSFTGTLTGMTATTSGSINYTVSGKIASLFIGGNLLGTSNAATMTMTGLSAAVQPANIQHVPCWQLEDNGVQLGGTCTVNGSTITFGLMSVTGSHIQELTGAWTTSGTKGLVLGWSITYPLN